MITSDFTPVLGIGGGALIGLSAAVLLLWAGEVLGASGIATAVLTSPLKALTDPSECWKVIFLATFMLLSNTVLGAYFTDDIRSEEDPSITVVSIAGYLIGGFFVGFGTTFGGGCTSGHGICGMARLSKRSIIAVIAFMISAIGTAVIVGNSVFSNATAFLRRNEAPDLYNRWLGFGVTMPFVLGAFYSYYSLKKAVQLSENEQNDNQPQAAEFPEYQKKQKCNPILDDVGKILPASLAAAIFAVGLAVAGMVLPSKVLGFLDVSLLADKTWDPTLMLVMGGGVIVSWISYQFVKDAAIISNKFVRTVPRRSSSFSLPKGTNFDFKLLFGSFCFGIGWGMAGICPGPAIFLAASGSKDLLFYWWPCYIVGSFLAKLLDN